MKTNRVLVNELTETSKIIKILNSNRIAFEQIGLDLITFSDLGDVVEVMPVIGLMRNQKSSFGKLVPGVKQEIDQTAEMIRGFMTERFSVLHHLELRLPVLQNTRRSYTKLAVTNDSPGEMFPSVPTNTQETLQNFFNYLESL